VGDVRLKTDPLERVNLAYGHHKRTPEQRQYKRLRPSWHTSSELVCSP
jgi:hypothetical protein